MKINFGSKVINFNEDKLFLKCLLGIYLEKNSSLINFRKKLE